MQLTEQTDLSISWHDAFRDFRRNGDAMSPAMAKARRETMTDAEWHRVTVEAQRWESVKRRSAIARSSLDLFKLMGGA